MLCVQVPQHQPDFLWCTSQLLKSFCTSWKSYIPMAFLQKFTMAAGCQSSFPTSSASDSKSSWVRASTHCSISKLRAFSESEFSNQSASTPSQLCWQQSDSSCISRVMWLANVAMGDLNSSSHSCFRHYKLRSQSILSKSDFTDVSIVVNLRSIWPHPPKVTMVELTPCYCYVSQGLYALLLTPSLNLITDILGIRPSFLFVIMGILGVLASSKNTK